MNKSLNGSRAYGKSRRSDTGNFIAVVSRSRSPVCSLIFVFADHPSCASQNSFSRAPEATSVDGQRHGIPRFVDFLETITQGTSISRDSELDSRPVTGEPNCSANICLALSPAIREKSTKFLGSRLVWYIKDSRANI